MKSQPNIYRKIGQIAVWVIVALVLLPRMNQPNNMALAQRPENETIILTLNKGTGNLEVGISNPIPELEPLGPQAIAVAEDGTFYILDSLNQRISGLKPITAPNGENETVQTANVVLSQSRSLADMVWQNDNFYLMGSDGVLQINPSGKTMDTYPVTAAMRQGASGFAIAQSGEVRWQVANSHEYALLSQSSLGDTEQTPLESEGLSMASVTQQTIRTEFVRLDSHQAELKIWGANGQLKQTLRLVTPNFLGTMLLKQIDQQGNYYVLVEELVENVPNFVVETTVRRFAIDPTSNEAVVDGIANVPLEGIYFLPKRFVTINDKGELYFLRVTPTSAQVVQLFFQKTSPPTSIQKKKENQLPPNSLDAQSSVTSSNVITRQQIIENARAYLNVNWVLGKANYGAGNLSCDSNNWALPSYLKERVGETISNVPYKWGGYMAVTTFLAGINEGKLAGDACWCFGGNYCITSNSVGVDCSGFVSQVLALSSYHTTYYLPDVSNEINWNELKAGDILNWASGHVMLFDSFSDGKNINGGVMVYESTSDPICNWSVCYNQRSFSNLSLYVPRRYKNVIEQSDPAPKTVFSGMILLQNRQVYSDTNILMSTSPCSEAITNMTAMTPTITTTDISGHFDITVPVGQVYQCVQAVHAGYLTAQKNLPIAGGDLGNITLLSGDVKPDNQIDIFDLAYVAFHYNDHDATADLNGDGVVNIFDLSLVAGNYKKNAPIAWP